MKKQIFALWSGGILLILLIFSVFLALNRKVVVLDEVSLKDYEDNSEGIFAIMIENDSGEYVEYTDSDSFPTSMVFNSTLSNCIDNDGNTIDNALSYSNGVATVNTSQTSYCYIYFDKSDAVLFSTYLISTSIDNGGSDSTLILHEVGCDNGCAEDEKYRYSGETAEVNNYVCFGTSDLDECLADTDTYLFRIIEVDPDTGYVKLIKYSYLVGDSNYMSWYYDVYFYWNWSDSLGDSYYYEGEANYWAVGSNWYDNGELYATLAYDLNTTYLESFDSSWQGIIEWYDWNIAGASDSIYGATPKEFYDSESSETATFQIGLMNIYDFAYSANSDYWNIGLWDMYTSYYINDDLIPWMLNESYDREWTIARDSDDSYDAWVVDYDGSVYNNGFFSDYFGVRPSFYLTSSVTYAEGSGTADSPYLLSVN